MMEKKPEDRGKLDSGTYWILFFLLLIVIGSMIFYLGVREGKKSLQIFCNEPLVTPDSTKSIDDI